MTAYHTRGWRRFRAIQLALYPVCEHCNRRDATDVHHKLSPARGGALLDPGNVESLCRRCHRLAHAGKPFPAPQLGTQEDPHG